MSAPPTHSSSAPSERVSLYSTETHRLYDAYRNESCKYTRQYVDANKSEVVRDVAIPILSSVATGAAVGLVCGCPAGPPGMGIGAGIGAGVGFIIGSTISGALVYRDYHAWQKKHAGSELEEIVRFFFQEDSVLREFICPIAACIIKTPVMTDDGKYYEKEAITKWIKSEMKAGRDPTCPLTRKHLSLDMLHDAPEGAALICARLMRITHQESQLRGLDRRVVEGLKALYSDLKRFVDRQHDLSVRKTFTMKKQRKISEEQFSVEMARLHEVFYPSIA